ncbi:hypothetical protein P153DRAFT_173054 [Dothidotthia symphoricarpi CBS 119687]|uniref:DUF7730 domain-containing protein n=1 Tax=Dothidotthia symphoricarpi CBS 119687 TaxID=1392245 RepID=A0A6A6ALA6_9PLEO|nr:uncharacterized protein P153DRAFT_173054 [Dothidotthia symphoricarpi CBS 119687]KAF2132762.1 hypothetical protein P153DRAFT_173054 [Dothidotthia symphoricarpi CBS 119687]
MMATRKEQLMPDTKTTAALLPKAAKVKKRTSAKPADASKRRSLRLAEKPRKYPVRRYKNGLLNLEETPERLVEIVKRNTIDSPLLRLPPELRNKIWAFTMSRQFVIVDPALESGEVIKKNCVGAVSVQSKSMDSSGGLAGHYQTKGLSSTFHLPKVSRQVYSETATLAYSTSTFIIGWSILNYNDWAKRLLPAQRNAIEVIEAKASVVAALVESPSYSKKTMIIQCFPNLKRFTITQKAFQEVKRYSVMYNPSITLTNEEYEVRIETRLKESAGADVDIVFEGNAMASGNSATA